MRVHVLKVWAEPYNELKAGRKTAEFRCDDRGGFRVGDVLVLQPWDPAPPYGTHVNLPALRAEISHVARSPHVPDGYAMLSLRGVREATADEDNEAMRTPGAYGLRTSVEAE